MNTILNPISTYNPISLSLRGIIEMQKKDRMEMRVMSIYFSAVTALLSYFSKVYSIATAYPHFFAILSPLEFSILSGSVMFLVCSIAFGILSLPPDSAK